MDNHSYEVSPSNSKMLLKKNGTCITKNNKPILCCSHRANQIFLKCCSKHNDQHIHCGRCGIIFKCHTKKMSQSDYKIYDYRGSCEKLTNHMCIYYNEHSL